MNNCAIAASRYPIPIVLTTNSFKLHLRTNAQAPDRAIGTVGDVHGLPVAAQAERNSYLRVYSAAVN